MAPSSFTAEPTYLIRAASRKPTATRLIQLGWLILQISALVMVIIATPNLYTEYQTTCSEHICDRLPHLNAGSAELLQQLGASMDDYALVMVTVEWLYVLLWACLGATIVWKRPHEPVALLLAGLGIVIGSNLFLGVLDRSQGYANLVATAGTLLTYAAMPLIVALFPDGRWVPRWTRWAALGGVVYAILAVLTPTSLWWLRDSLSFPLAVGVWGSLLAGHIIRYRRVSTAVQRQQTKWLLFGIALFVLNILIVLVSYATGLIDRYQPVVVLLCYGSTMIMVVAIGFAILRYRLFDIDVIINRALVYGGLSATVIAGYALIVVVMGMLLRRESVIASFLAAAVIAAAFQPLHSWLQRRVNRLLYGNRDDPYAILVQLGQRLDATMSPETMLPTIAETVSSTLKLPYVALTLRQGDTDVVVATAGTPSMTAAEVIPMTFQGNRVGALLVTLRPGEHGLSSTDQRLLHDLARQAGVAGQAVRLNRALRRSREQLVTAREEERRRLRRDLHDGLGPTFASQALTIDAAIMLLEREPASAVALLHEAKQQSQVAVQEIRRVVNALRPPALDDLGLVGALREMASHAPATSLAISIDAPDPLAPLPAAVEVAIYRIAQEALTNVIRHANAHQCHIQIEIDGDLSLIIADDGIGIDENRRAGVGLASLRERAEELGGTCVVSSHLTGGTQVHARLPLS